MQEKKNKHLLRIETISRKYTFFVRKLCKSLRSFHISQNPQIIVITNLNKTHFCNSKNKPKKLKNP